jgi:uncharacterized protein (DUF362 family)/ferredoxin
MIEYQMRNERGTVVAAPAWTMNEIDQSMGALLDCFAEELPSDLQAHILIKPNLNNDLIALTGNCTDLRVLAALVEALQGRGYTQITVADGSNVGIDRRGIDTFARLRIDKLSERLGFALANLNTQPGRQIELHGGANPRIASIVEDCDYLISVPTIKTHVEAGMSCAMKNWVGIVVGQDKRQMHFDLCRNIQAIHEHVSPDLVIVDGVVGMEGNGPGDGDPFRFGWLMGANHAALCDAVVARLIDMPINDIPYLGHAIERGMLSSTDVDEAHDTFPVLRPIRPAPPRASLAKLSEHKSLQWLKKAVRPMTNKPAVLEAAYKLGVVQDVYCPDDDEVKGVRRAETDCGPCTACADVCPTRLPIAEIGVKTQMPDCISCMYCWWVCPDDVIQLDGSLHAMERQVERYKLEIENL